MRRIDPELPIAEPDLRQELAAVDGRIAALRATVNAVRTSRAASQRDLTAELASGGAVHPETAEAVARDDGILNAAPAALGQLETERAIIRKRIDLAGAEGMVAAVAEYRRSVQAAADALLLATPGFFDKLEAIGKIPVPPVQHRVHATARPADETADYYANLTETRGRLADAIIEHVPNVGMVKRELRQAVEDIMGPLETGAEAQAQAIRCELEALEVSGRSNA